MDKTVFYTITRVFEDIDDVNERLDKEEKYKFNNLFEAVKKRRELMITERPATVQTFKRKTNWEIDDVCIDCKFINH